MNATILIFDVFPLTLGVVGFMVTLSFGPEVFRWLTRQLAAQRNSGILSSSDAALLVEREAKIVKMKRNDNSNAEREPDSKLIVVQ